MPRISSFITIKIVFRPQVNGSRNESGLPGRASSGCIIKGYSQEYRQVQNDFASNLVSTRFLKYLIRPGDILFRPRSSRHDAIRAISSPSSTKSSEAKYVPWTDPRLPRRLNVWQIEVAYFSFSGDFRRTTETLYFHMPAKTDESFPLLAMLFYPLRFEGQATLDLLLKRGQIFWSCRKRRYVEYVKENGFQSWSSLTTRYMIDHSQYYRIPSHEVFSGDISIPADLAPHLFQLDECPPYPFAVLLPKTLKAFSFVEKEWVSLEIDYIREVEWNTKAFESLVTEDATKEMIEALVKNHLDIETSTDLIAGKGSGLIILLHGGPGTGKTYTAESVADYAPKAIIQSYVRRHWHESGEMSRNIYKGHSSGEEHGIVLFSWMKLISSSEERSFTDLSRNALVSVFLRIVEYYDGILILTSNRVGHFDEAFKSRIQLSLHYKSLTMEQRNQIWINSFKHLHISNACDMDYDDIMWHIGDLAKHQLNGREIRNVITTARSLSKHKNAKLNYKYLNQVISVTREFDQYLLEVKRAKGLNGGTIDDEIAREDGKR